MQTVEHSFKLFRSRHEMLPTVTRRHLARLVRQDVGRFLPTNVQYEPTSEGGLWAFIDGRNVCLAQAGGAVACAAINRAKSEGLTLGVFSPPSRGARRPHNFLVMALVPDGVSRLTAHIGKRTRSLVVTNNVAAATSDYPIMLEQLHLGS